MAHSLIMILTAVLVILPVHAAHGIGEIDCLPEDVIIDLEVGENGPRPYDFDVDGDTMIFYDSRPDHGRRIRFFLNVDGTWQEDVKSEIVPPGDGVTWYPHSTVSISGNTAVVGLEFGKAIVLERAGGSWNILQTLTSPEADSTFGLFVDIDGDVIVTSDLFSNTVHVYRRLAGLFYEEQRLSSGTVSSYGWGVAVEGSTLLIGAVQTGYLYNHNGSGWYFSQIIESEHGGAQHCDLHGNTAIIGNDIFVRVEGTWVHEQTLDVPDEYEVNQLQPRRIGEDIAVISATVDAGNDTPTYYLVYERIDSQWDLVSEVFCQQDAYNPLGVACVSGRQVFMGLKEEHAYWPDRILIKTLPVQNSEEQDCNLNGVCDSLDLAVLSSFDCDGNSVPDVCDIADGTQSDVDGNGVPDACQADCDLDGWPDAYELAEGLELDCNGNGIPDTCDISSGSSPDGDADGIPDECDPSYVITVAADGSALFDDIQSALELALPGATISVSPGLYFGRIYLPLYQVQLVSESGPEDTSLRLFGSEDEFRIMEIPPGHDSDTLIHGFTFYDDVWLEEGISEGGALLISESTPTISGCVFADHEAERGGAVMVSGGLERGACRFVDCTWKDNTALGFSLDRGGGGGLAIRDAFVVLESCTFDGNAAEFSGGGIWLQDLSSLEAHDTTWSSNWTPLTGGGISHIDCDVSLSDSLFCGNDPDDIFGGWTDEGGNDFNEQCIDCAGDLTGDGVVGVDDLMLVISGWNDLYHVDDLLAVLLDWGACE